MPEIANIDHFTYGPITPVLAYALSVLGALLGLTCAARARSTTHRGRRAWFLLLAAWAIGGTGIWVMHFMAMLGFGLEGSEIRYDVPITVVSAVIAITVVAVGLFTAGFGRPNAFKIILGGTFAGLGVASMHYTGMAAMRIDGTVQYDPTLVAASIAIAVVAATVALWLAVTVRRLPAVIGSAMVMGVAVCGMHYTGMFAMEVHLHTSDAPLTGATAFALILPITLLVIFVVIGLIYALLAAPSDEDQAGAAFIDARIAGRGPGNGATLPPSQPGGTPLSPPAPNGQSTAPRTSVARSFRRR
jgi:NO-binding membrane sensor protein with MHYT domain